MVSTMQSPLKVTKLIGENPIQFNSYDAHIEVNTYGLICVTRKFFATYIRKSLGQIVNLSSIIAPTNMEGINAYSISNS